MANEKYTELPIGGMIVRPGNAEEYNTGSWRVKRPEFIAENCIKCGFCFIYCPDSAVDFSDGETVKFDLLHCKGCGVCAEECPGKKIEGVTNKAIVMKLESECGAVGTVSPSCNVK
jgi:pyruvate ferredoxin oxidoreductase delta subunit